MGLAIRLVIKAVTWSIACALFTANMCLRQLVLTRGGGGEDRSIGSKLLIFMFLLLRGNDECVWKYLFIGLSRCF